MITIGGKKYKTKLMVFIPCGREDCKSEMLLSHKEVSKAMKAGRLNEYICGVCYEKELEDIEIVEESDPILQ